MPAQASAPRARIQLSSSQRPLTFEVEAINELGESVSTAIAGEAPLTLYLDKREIVTLMTLGQAPEALALGYLRNQRLLPSMDNIASVQVDWETNAVAITTNASAPESEDHETQTLNAQHLDQRLSKRTVTTGCGQGTVFGDLMQDIDNIRLRDDVRLSDVGLHALLQEVRQHESVYKSAGAVHGCALFALPSLHASTHAATHAPLYFVEDVGRHNAVDAIAGMMWLDGIDGSDKLFYTTGRLTSEMVIKTAQMGIPFLVSRSGLTRMGWEIAQRIGISMIGRASGGKHYLLFTGRERFVQTLQAPTQLA